MLKKITLLLFTLRHLKPIQFYWRIYLKLNRLRTFNCLPPAVIPTHQLSLLAPIPKHASLVDGRFVFLNHAIPASFPIVWNDAEQAKLWLYNLHYFDYLNQPTIDTSKADALIRDWITHNVVGQGNGWEPYTLSLRIVNWIKYISHSSPAADADVINASLYLQCRFLFEHLEYHLLGNHLFKNGVALVYAGSYFQGAEAEDWLKRGLLIINAQIKEQVLPDGGHFERSPMYHNLILEDILDCLNLHQARACFSAAEGIVLTNTAENMSQFVADTVHPDGDIGFFNDSALGIAPKPDDLLAYATRLGLHGAAPSSSLDNGATVSLIEKPTFGLYVLQNIKGRMLFDAGVIGPDYLPGHAHCDTLSYELSLFGQRCIVNSGTYQYAGHERNDFRATAAHNTVSIDNQEQHEIWSTFRVARRGYPFDIKVVRQDTSVSVSAAHNGFKRFPGHPTHRRTVTCSDEGWQIEDSIEGQGQHLAESFIHLHPAVEIVTCTESEVLCALPDGQFVITVDGSVNISVVDTFYSPEFGLKQASKTLCLSARQTCPFVISYKIALA